MKPLSHVAVSAFLGATFLFFTKSIYAGVLCFASGILVDFDHIIEYIIHYGWKTLSLKNVYRASENTCKKNNKNAFKKLYLIFHAYEITAVFWVVAICTRNMYLVAIALGYSIHLVLDCVGNPMYPSCYFMLWRAIRKFDIEKAFRENRTEDSKC